VNHLFIECSFIKNVWVTVSNELKLHSGWVGGEIEDCFKRWFLKKENREETPCYIYWEVWKHRSLIIFENVIPSLGRVCTCILQDLG